MTKGTPNSGPTDDAIEQGLQDVRRLEDAPEHVIQRAVAIASLRRAAVPMATAPGLLQRVLAVLTFDSGAASALAYGARSGGGAMRQMLFSAHGRDLDLRVGPAAPDSAAGWQITGQVLGPDTTGTVVVVDAMGAPVTEAELSELGEFRLPAVPAGTYGVLLRLPGIEIALPPVQIPQAT